MRERNKKKLIYSSNSEKAIKAFQKFESKFESEQVRKKYIERMKSFIYKGFCIGIENYEIRDRWLAKRRKKYVI